MDQNFQTMYQPLAGANDVQIGGTEEDDDLSPDTHSSMVFHVDKASKPRWNHLENLDFFFSRVYQYHQNSGLLCMILQQVLEQVQFVFIMFFTTFLLSCVDYDILFKNKSPAHEGTQKVIGLVWSGLVLGFWESYLYRIINFCLMTTNTLLVFSLILSCILYFCIPIILCCLRSFSPFSIVIK